MVNFRTCHDSPRHGRNNFAAKNNLRLERIREQHDRQRKMFALPCWKVTKLFPDMVKQLRGRYLKHQLRKKGVRTLMLVRAVHFQQNQGAAGGLI